MSSPSRRNPISSPIRHLEDRSPPRPHRLHTILEENALENHTKGILSHNSSLMVENNILAEKVRDYADESHYFSLENSKLKKENDILKEKNYVSNTIEHDRLQRELILKDAELEKVINDM